MANKELMITLGLDSSTFTQKVKKARDLNKELDKSFQLLSSSSKDFENTIQGLGKKQEYLNKKMQLASEEADIYAERLTECQLALEKSQEEAQLYADQLTKLKRQQEAIGKALGTTSKEYLAITEKVKATTQLLDKANKAWVANDKRVTDASIGYKNAQIAVQELGREAILASEKMSAMKADEEMKDLSEAIKESQRNFENMKNSVVGFDNTMEGLDKTQTHYTAQIAKMNELISKQKSELSASNKVLSDYEDELSRLNIQMSEYEEVMATMDGTENMFDEVRAEAEALRLEYSSLNRTIEFHKDRVNSLNTEYKSNEATLAKFNQSLDASTKKMVEMNNKVTFEPISKKIKELTNNNITKLEDKLSELNNEFDIVTTTVEGLEGTISGLIVKNNHYNKTLEVSKNILSEYKTELTSIKSETQKLTNEQKELEQEIAKQISLLKNLKGAEWDKQVESIDKLKARYQEVNKSLDLHNKRVKTLESGYNSSRKNVAQLTSELEKAKSELENLNRASKLDVLDKNIKSISSEIKKLEDAFEVAKSSVVNFDLTKQGLNKTAELYAQKLNLLRTQMNNYKSSIDENTKEINRLKKEYEELGKSCDALKLKLLSLDKASPEYNETLVKLASLESKMKEVRNEAERLADSNDELQSELSQTTVETNELTLAQNRLSAEFKSNTLQNLGSKFTSLGNGISAVGNSLMGVTFGAVGAMTAIGKTGIEFDAQMSKVGALTGDTGEKLEETMAILEEGARNLAKTSKFSATEMAQGLEDLVLAGYDAEKAVATLPLAMQFAQAGTIELSTATEDLIMALSSLGNNSELVGDDLQNMTVMANQIALVANATTTDLDGVARSLLKVGGQVENMKIPLSSASTMIGILGDKGILAEEAGNSLNSILINLTQSSGQSADAMEALGMSAFDANGNIKPIEKTLGQLKKKLASFDGDKQEIILTNMLGGKTQAKTLQKLLQGIDADTGDFIEKYKTLKTELEGTIDISQLENGTTALEAMAEAMNDNLKGDIANMTSALEEGAISIFKKYEPQIREFVQKITQAILDITDKINNLTPAQLEMIASFAKWAVVAPMALKVIGGITSGFGGLVSGVGKAYDLFKDTKTVINAGRAMSSTASAVGATTSAMAGASSSISGVSLASKIAGKAILGLGSFIGGLGAPALITAGAVGAIGVAGVAMAKKLSKDCVPEVDLFADHVEKIPRTFETAMGGTATTYDKNVVKISEATQKAVGSYLEMDESVRDTMSSLFTNTTIVTGEIVTDMENKFGTLGNTIKESLSKNAEESINSLNTLFANSQALSEEEKAKALESEANFYEEKKNKVTEAQNQIMEILRNASANNRELKLEEVQQIQELQNQLRESAINTLSNQEVEAQVILQRMKDNDNRLTAEMVSENIKQLNQQRDEAKKNAEEQYEETVRMANKACYETGSISEEQKEKIIKEAGEQKQGVLDEADETHKKALEKIKELGGDTIKQVDLDTGKIKSEWQKLKDEWDLWSPVKKFFKAVFTKEEKTVKTTEKTPAKAKSFIPMNVAEDAERAISKMSAVSVPISLADSNLNMRNYKTSGGLYSGTTAESSSVINNSNRNSLVDALIQQNQLLSQLLTSATVNVGVNVDGREIARSSAKFMESEINKISKRKNRIGGLAY